MKSTPGFPRRTSWLCLVVLGPALLIGLTLSADDGDRKVTQRVSPKYPEIARNFNATGTVKLQIEITPGGEVKSVKVIGGHPLLIPAAEDAVRKWKYEPAKQSTTAIVEFRFSN